MKTQRRLIPVWLVLSVLVLAGLACSLGASDGGDISPTAKPPDARPTEVPSSDGTASPGLSRSERAALISGTVQIYGMQDQGGQLVPFYVGSGTVIDKRGLILTNAHVGSPAAFAAAYGFSDTDPDALAIGLVESEDKPPVFSYLAEVAAVDGFLDLAVLQITATLDGRSIDPSDLDLPYVGMGDPDEIHVGDPVYIFGFPAIGGETITFTTGNVSGFTAEEQTGDRGWIKTDATISGGNSGGLAASDDARIIGVPSKLGSGGYGSNVDFTDCRVVQDTNGDGQVDDRDTCIPTGGFINAIRPINFAKPLIDAAKSGLAYQSPYTVPGGGRPTADATGNEQFGPITWFSVDDQGNFLDPVNSYPSGTGTVVATFEFAGMADGELWAEVWSIDGEQVYSDQYQWDQGNQGSYYTWLANGGDPLPDGAYHVELYAGPNMPLLTEGDVSVGGGGGQPATPHVHGDVFLYGTIIDGDTNRAIGGAVVGVLMPGVTYDQWSGDEAEVFTWAETDRNGQYALPDPIARDTPYTIFVYAEGYRSKYGDGLVWTAQDPSQYQFDLSLVK